jgi:hypothetical protein
MQGFGAVAVLNLAVMSNNVSNSRISSEGTYPELYMLLGCWRMYCLEKAAPLFNSTHATCSGLNRLLLQVWYSSPGLLEMLCTSPLFPSLKQFFSEPTYRLVGRKYFVPTTLRDTSARS